MAHRKLDMGKAWTLATALMGGNRDTISAIAGLFFFLPSFAAGIFVPELSNPPQPAGGADSQAAMEAVVAQVSAVYTDNWPIFLGIFMAQFIGSMSLFALLSDRGNPTVGEALGTGIRSIPSYIAAQLIVTLAAGLAIGLPLGLAAAAAPPAVLGLLLIAALVAMVYVFMKLSLIAPVIAVEGERNPLQAIARSWRLTKGNSLRIALFLFLLLFTIGIIAALVSGLLGVVLAALGEPVATIGIDLVSAIVNAVVTVIFLVVTAAIHRQLAGPSSEALADTFA